ncbi:Malate synthase, glyoxysomal [Hondaea fermentalgiana]|uniref:Malate synthase, glyoxysomal n=1 Tax=Hondaea fermentalgiana TaxID=2315210 RepID=A0A2R5GKM0_9STRA|nr:Malate synthase, glyoxysomal [Hondaea fermentalgiana]|eukprot:GBG31427.1 Malate synthase, glyoxysomal [Hondaea fermentalgiana]
MSNYVRIGGLNVHRALRKVIEEDIAPGTGITANKAFEAIEALLKEFAPQNEALLRKRDAIQAQIDTFCLANKDKWDPSEYAAFLASIGYLVPEGPEFKVDTDRVDAEISVTPGPQLVVPVDNARYALNAANARWGSLLDAFYGTDAGPPETDGAEKGKGYNPARGAKVFELTHAFLDEHFPLASGAKYGDVKEFRLNGSALEVALKSNKTAALSSPEKFVGYNKGGAGLTSVVLRNNNLHVIIEIDANSEIGKGHAAGVSNVILESALTAICDMEDSVAAVDAEDKAHVYANWCGLMRGDLQEKFSKGGKTMVRKMNPDKTFTAPDGSKLVLPGRTVLLVRNVGLHLTNDFVTFAETNQPVPENIVDCFVAVLAGMHDLKKPDSAAKNSRAGSINIVRPKLHGPEEVAMVNRMFDRVEQLLGLAPNTVKIGVMDEERRTSANLKECIREVKSRCIFINTGFLDRTGDEIHTSFRLGPMLPKGDIKAAAWRLSYEDRNVDIGIATGLVGRAQIGKGMWAKPDMMKEMLEKKITEPKQGATTAWVPSPTAGTLHAIHYHMVDVLAVQKEIEAGGPRGTMSDLLTPPLVPAGKTLSKEVITHEMKDMVQVILGYVSRWIFLGVGCSKVPDINDVGLMEDRATLRISSQLLGNWLHFGLITEEELISTAKEMAKIVDRQNQGQAGYVSMAPDFSDNGFRCAIEMILNARDCPNGLTEGTLAKFRRAEKARLSGSKL